MGAGALAAVPLSRRIALLAMAAIVLLTLFGLADRMHVHLRLVFVVLAAVQVGVEAGFQARETVLQRRREKLAFVAAAWPFAVMAVELAGLTWVNRSLFLGDPIPWWSFVPACAAVGAVGVLSVQLGRPYVVVRPSILTTAFCMFYIAAVLITHFNPR